MSQTTDRTASTTSAGAYAPPSAAVRAALTTQCLLAIVSGRPLPEAARPRPLPTPRPATVREGIERMLRGPA